ncbi:endoglucanase 2-like [Populus alba x Populus x berolinensis]|nr:endoglucanase 2-like [Populus alba x Populus x berolinensis]
MRVKPSSRGCCWWFLVVVTLALVYDAISKRKLRNLKGLLLITGPPGAIEKKYADALKIAMQFFDIQRWDSALTDGILSWAILEYGGQMAEVNQLDPAQDSLKWITDYLINAHPEENVLYVQSLAFFFVIVKAFPETGILLLEKKIKLVGDPEIDHGCWERPEVMSEKRPLTQINTSSPGTEVAAETAAALASASLVYSSTLLKHAKELFTFADKYRGSYSESIPEVSTYYNSTGYGDELLWAASWLYHATGDKSYLQYVTGKNGEVFAQWESATWFSWDNKLAGTQVLLSRLTFFGNKDTSNSGLQMYRKTAEAVMCSLIPDSPTATQSRTDSGLIWVSEWNALQHPVASAFLASLYSDYMHSSGTAKLSCNGYSYKPSDLRKFARSQADYVLGNNPMKMSFLVGYGENYPQYVHHRGASIPADAKTGCKDGWTWLERKEPNPNVATGALVGGPFLNETFVDDRNNSMQAEPTTYNGAVIVGLLSGLVTTSSAVPSFT